MTTYYRDPISGEIFNESDALTEALDRIDYAEAFAQLLGRYSIAEIIESVPTDIQEDIFDHAAEQYIYENFEECDEPEEDEDDD